MPQHDTASSHNETFDTGDRPTILEIGILALLIVMSAAAVVTVALKGVS